MKIYILADMEGISGIRLWDYTRKGDPLYAEGVSLMMRDINACIAGCFDGGADQVIACDTHAGGGQLRLAEMDERALYEMPTGGGTMMPELDESFDGVVLLGHHARAGTINGFLDHTMSSAEIFEVRVNDQVVGEIGLEAAYAGHFGVPVIMVSGDQTTANEAKELLGENLPCAVVKWGIGRNRAGCLPVARANELIRQTTKAAVQRLGGDKKSFPVHRPKTPATVQMTLYRSDFADSFAAHNEVTRLDARTVSRQVRQLRDIWRW